MKKLAFHSRYILLACLIMVGFIKAFSKGDQPLILVLSGASLIFMYGFFRDMGWIHINAKKSDKG